jgi:hypothetical protein
MSSRPRPVLGEPEPQLAPAAGQAACDGEDAQAEPFGFPAAGLCRQGEHLPHAMSSQASAGDLAPDRSGLNSAPGKRG